jgi:hypothetical protein
MLSKPTPKWHFFGERGRNRTYNLLIKSQLLCQLSYAPILLTRLNLDDIFAVADVPAVGDFVGTLVKTDPFSPRADRFIASKFSNARSSDSGDGCTYR